MPDDVLLHDGDVTHLVIILVRILLVSTRRCAMLRHKQEDGGTQHTAFIGLSTWLKGRAALYTAARYVQGRAKV